ncbi:MAG: UPF0182 family protein, partial [Propionibacteriaceae bacterium]|nr:UPF0182 family protein [Propionibacteriaceae bacterium]
MNQFSLTRLQRVLIIVAAALAAGFGIVAFLTHIYTEWLWYGSVGQQQVYTTRLITAVGLFIAFAALVAALIAVSGLVALKLRPRSQRPKQPEGLSQLAVVLLVALGVGVMAGSGASGQVDTFLTWRSAQPFGEVDAYFGLDLGFYVFTLPWWRMVLGYVMTGLVVGGIVAVTLHVLNGVQETPPVKVRARETSGVLIPDFALNNPLTKVSQGQLSVTVALILVVYGIQRLLSRYGFAVSDNDDLFTGIGYTDDHSRITAALVVAVISFICAAVFAANAFLRRWPVAVAAIALMVVSSLIVSTVYPGIVQRFSVRPDEPIVEAPYISAHIEATREAYDIDRVEITAYSAETNVSAGQLRADAEALPGIRLMDPEVIAPAFEQLQQVRGYYSFPAVLDVDRYTIEGQMTDAIVAAREIDMASIPDQSWNNLHTVYTHGYAMVAAYGNRRQPSGEPSWIVGDIPPTGALSEHQARIYFGTRTTEYAIVGAPEGTPPVELDTPGGGTEGAETRNTYAGSGGVSVGGLFNRLLFALKFTDLNLLLSDRVNEESVILFDRTPTERVTKMAPWLSVDGNPFPAIVDGRVVWIMDGYTTTSEYPNSQHVQLGNGTSINYMRNSVKATVDALDGTVSLYAWDETDPILATWMQVFPGLLQPKSAISADLMQHLRYPEDLFRVQRQVLGRYHTTNPDTWYQQSDLWQVPSDPRATSAGVKEPPYYLSIKWPDDEQPVFSLTAVYVPRDRENLGAYLAVVADASSPDYGRLRVLKLSDTQQIAGPGQTFNAITTDQAVADRLLPYTKQGSAQAIYGNLLTLPLGGGLIYVEPIYTQRKNESTSATGSYPVLRFVVVRFGEHIGIGDTLQEALDMVFAGDSGAETGENPGDGTGPGTPPDPDTPTDPGVPIDPGTPTEPDQSSSAAVKALLAEAEGFFVAADKALQAGDLAGYQAQLARAR